MKSFDTRNTLSLHQKRVPNWAKGFAPKKNMRSLLWRLSIMPNLLLLSHDISLQQGFLLLLNLVNFSSCKPLPKKTTTGKNAQFLRLQQPLLCTHRTGCRNRSCRRRPRLLADFYCLGIVAALSRVQIFFFVDRPLPPPPRLGHWSPYNRIMVYTNRGGERGGLEEEVKGQVGWGIRLLNRGIYEPGEG